MIYVNGFPYAFKEGDVQELFGKYGKITEISLPTYQDNPTKLRGFGFITFSSPAEAKKALEMNGYDCGGRSLRVEPKAQKPESENRKRNDAPAKALSSTPPDGCDTLFCGNLSFQIQDDDIYAFFKECGEISQIRYGEDKQTGQFKGFAFVQFSDPNSVVAGGQLNGQLLKGRPVKIDYSEPRNKRQ